MTMGVTLTTVDTEGAMELKISFLRPLKRKLYLSGTYELGSEPMQPTLSPPSTNNVIAGSLLFKGQFFANRAMYVTHFEGVVI